MQPAPGVPEPARHISTAVWSGLEGFCGPILLLIATPVLLRLFGSEQYGLLMFVNSIAAFGGIVGLGIGSATIRFVADARGRDRESDIAAIVQASLGSCLIVFLVMQLTVSILSWWIATIFFERLGDAGRTALLICLSAALVGIQQLDSIYAGAFKGLLRFRLSAVLECGVRVVLVLALVAAGWLCADVVSALVVQVAILCLGAIAKGFHLSGLLNANVLRPSLHGEHVRNVFHFGKWVWIANISSVVFSTFDRLVVASLFGAAALSTYVICQQPAQVVHAAAVACFQGLFPRVGADLHRFGGGRMREWVRRAIQINVGVAVVFFVPIMLAGHELLSVWMGSAFADENENLFLMFLATYFLLALNVASYFILLGLGEAKTIAMTISVGAVASVMLLLAFAPEIGPDYHYVVLARLPYALAALLLIHAALIAKQGPGSRPGNQT